MAILGRLSPRVARGSFVGNMIQRTSGSASAALYTDEFFGLVATISSGQGTSTSDIIASAAASTSLVSSQGSITSDITAQLTSGFAADTGQGTETSDLVVAVPFDAPIDTRQGEATSDISCTLVDFQSIKPVGFLDGANITVQPGSPFWGSNPRVLGTTIVGQITRGGALGALAEDAGFTPVPYNTYADGFGTAAVGYASQSVTGQGWGVESFGTATVYLGQQWITGTGINYGAFGTASIYNYTRYITGTGFGGESFGTLAISGPFTQTIGLGSYGIDGTAVFGTALIESNARLVTPAGVHTWAIGTPTIIGPRYLSPPRIDPNGFGVSTIYNLTQYPAIQGFNDTVFGTAQVVGPRIVRATGTLMSLYGGISLRVEHANRTISPSWPNLSVPRPSNPKISNKDRAIYAVGFSPSEFGGAIVAIPPFDIVWPDSTVDDYAVFGTPNLSVGARAGTIFLLPGIPPGGVGSPAISPHYIKPTGFVATKFGTTWVSNYIRYLGAANFVATKFGTAWVSNYKRYVYPTGYDSSVVWNPFGPINADGSVPGVYNATGGSTGLGGVSVYGIGPETFGNTNIDVGTHYADPSSFSSYGVGVPTILTVKRILVSGWNDTVFGDVQKWEAGKIKPQGEDYTVFGTARMGAQVVTSGDSFCRFGYPRMKLRLLPSGISLLADLVGAFGQTTVSYSDGNEFVCGLGAHSIPIAGFGDGEFGAATVSN